MEILLTLKSDKSLFQDKNLKQQIIPHSLLTLIGIKKEKHRQTHQMKSITDRLRDLIMSLLK
jgi:hypothetical protein